MFCLFVLLAVIVLLPGSLRLGQALIGYPGDSFQHAWFLWHFARAVSHGQNPYFTNLIFYPHRVNLAWSTLDPLASLLALPFSLVAGPIVAYNVSLITQLALAAFCAYLLCLRVCGNVIAAVLGGACFAFSPWLMGEALGHLSLVTAFPIPLYFLALDRMLCRGGGWWKSGLATGLALFLSALAHYNYTAFCILLTVVIVAVDLSLDGRVVAEKIWKPLTVAIVTFGALFLPLFLTMWGNPAARPQSRSLDLIEGHSADVLGWFVPSWNHMLLGRFAQRWNLGLFSAGYEGVVYLGPVILFLVILGLSSGMRGNRRWTIRLLVTALIFWLLSLGPRIRVWGHDTGVPGPAFLFYASPFGRFVSAPARFHVMAMLAFAGLASMGVAFILKKFGDTKVRVVIVGVLSMALALDLLTLPFPVATSAASAQHRGFAIPIDGCRIPTDINGTTVVTVPELEWPYPVRAMWMQVNEGGRYALADGYVSYGPNSIWDKFWDAPVLRALRSVQDGNESPIDIAAVRQSMPKAVRDLNIGAFVIFDFPQRDPTVDYLQQILAQTRQRQFHCTIFDLRSAGTNVLKTPVDTLY
ncbi:MAG TPA: hypothetical protein VIY69_09985 [Candidatus Acidoferrales bacterium]